MSRRRAAIAVATSLVAAGVIPLSLSMASAAPDCPSWDDPKGDAAMFMPVTGTPAGDQEPTGNTADPNLDITNMTFGVDGTKIYARAKIAQLATASKYGAGDAWRFYFNIGTKQYRFEVYRPKHPDPTAGGPTGPLLAYADMYDGSKTAPAIADFNVTASTLTISTKLSDFATLLGKPIDGVEIGTFLARAYTNNDATYTTWDLATAPTSLKYTLSSEACTAAVGGPTPTGSPSATGTPAPTGSPSPSPTGTPPATPSSKLVNAGAVSSQYGDVASVAAKLTTASGAALVGKTVTFKLAGKTGSAKTNSAGVASLKLALASAASAQTLVASFAGDSSAKASSVSTKFTIVVEKTKITMAVAKSGTARTVTATLLEDDNRALGSQKLVVYVNGVKKATLTTDAKGKVVYKAAKAGQTVKFAFAAVTGKWAASSVQQKLS